MLAWTGGLINGVQTTDVRPGDARVSRRRFARPASARRSRWAGWAASAHRTQARGRSSPGRRSCSRCSRRRSRLSSRRSPRYGITFRRASPSVRRGRWRKRGSERSDADRHGHRRQRAQVCRSPPISLRAHSLVSALATVATVAVPVGNSSSRADRPVGDRPAAAPPAHQDSVRPFVITTRRASLPWPSLTH